MAKEMTKKEKYAVAIEMAQESNNNMLVEFFKHEIELLERKRSDSNARENEKANKFMELVYTALSNMDRMVTVSELIANGGLDDLSDEYGLVSTQKVTAYLKKLCDRDRVERIIDKKKTYFKVKS